jgi:hypothetical protein
MELGLNLEKAIKQSKFTPSSPIKATPSELASNSDIVSNRKTVSNQDISHPATLSDPAILCNSTILSNPATLSDPAILCNSARLSNPAMPSDPVTLSNPLALSNADDVMLMSPSKSKDVHNYNSNPTASNPHEGKTTAVIAVMRGNPMDGYTRLCSNKHCKQRMVCLLLDTGSDSDLIFVSKDKPMLLPYSKRLVPQLWNTSNGIFQTWCKARVELNFFKYSDSKRFHVEPDVVKYDKDSKPQYDLILGTNTMKESGIILNFRYRMITIDEIILPMRNINNLQGSSILLALRHNHSLAMEPQSTQDTTQNATQILDAKYSKADLKSIVSNNCKHLSADLQKKLLQLLKNYESLFDGTLDDWKTKPVSFQLKEGVSSYHGRAFPVPKIHKTQTLKRWKDNISWGYWRSSQHLNGLPLCL